MLEGCLLMEVFLLMCCGEVEVSSFAMIGCTLAF